jgi:hypothetical protein
MINHEEHLLRALPDTGARNGSILEAYTLATFIKKDDRNTTTWITVAGKLTKNKLGW